jgi:CRP-like cAMP-binding protein
MDFLEAPTTMHLDTIKELLRGFEPWNALPEVAWPELWQATRLVSIPKHKIVFHPADRGLGIFFVADGLVKLSKSAPEGKDTVILLAQQGDTIGEQLIGSMGCYACRALTLSDSLLAEVSAEWVEQAAQTYPAFGWAFCQFLLERLREAEERLMRHRFNLTRQRIGLFLKVIASHHSRSIVNGEVELRLPLTHGLIGEMVGVSRQQVSTIFIEWAKKGIIRYNRKRIVLSKPEML